MKILSRLIILFSLSILVTCGSPFYDPAYMNSAYLINRMDFRGSYDDFPFSVYDAKRAIFLQNAALIVSSTYPDRYANFITVENQFVLEATDGIYDRKIDSYIPSAGMADTKGLHKMLIFPMAKETLTMGVGYITNKMIGNSPGAYQMNALGYTFTDYNTTTSNIDYLWSWDQAVFFTPLAVPSGKWDGDYPPPTPTSSIVDQWALDDSIAGLLGTDELDITYEAMNSIQLNSGQRKLQLVAYDTTTELIHEVNQLFEQNGTDIYDAVLETATSFSTFDRSIFEYFLDGIGDTYNSYYAHDPNLELSVISVFDQSMYSFSSFSWSTHGSGVVSADDINVMYDISPSAHVAGALGNGGILFISETNEGGDSTYVLHLMDGSSRIKRLNCGYLIYVGETIIDDVSTCIFNMLVEEHQNDINIRKISTYTIATEDLLELF